MTIIPIRGENGIPRSKMETRQLTLEELEKWVLPDFQAPLRINAKVEQIAKELAEQDGVTVISGIITLGYLTDTSTTIYLLDGQHRRAAAKLSGKKEFLADIRIKFFDSVEDMALEYLHLNSPISKKTPDDQLRALHESSKPLQYIGTHCDFIGYRFIRSNPDAPLVGMSGVIRRWFGSAYETPGVQGQGGAASIASKLTMDDAERIVQFMNVAYSAWGRDLQNMRLWGGLNMTMCMWLWRVLVLDKDRSGPRRYVCISEDEFRHCLMSVSADSEYTAWLAGRNMTERERAPCYRRLRSLFAARIRESSAIMIDGQNYGPTKVRMPQPLWMNN